MRLLPIPLSNLHSLAERTLVPITEPAAPLCHLYGLRGGFIKPRLEILAHAPGHFDGGSHIVS
jgi:hypothetical protein